MTTVNGKQVEALQAHLDRERERTREEKARYKVERDRVKVLRGALDAANQKRRELAKEMLAQREEIEALRRNVEKFNRWDEALSELRAENTRLKVLLRHAIQHSSSILGDRRKCGQCGGAEELGGEVRPHFAGCWMATAEAVLTSDKQPDCKPASVCNVCGKPATHASGTPLCDGCCSYRKAGEACPGSVALRSGALELPK